MGEGTRTRGQRIPSVSVIILKKKKEPLCNLLRHCLIHFPLEMNGCWSWGQGPNSRCPFYKNLHPEGQREDAAFLSRQDSSMERGGGHERYWQLIPSRRGRVSFKSVVCGGLTTLQEGHTSKSIWAAETGLDALNEKHS